jgi:hypothetical protein
VNWAEGWPGCFRGLLLQPSQSSEQRWGRNGLVSKRKLVRSTAILRLVVARFPKRLNGFNTFRETLMCWKGQWKEGRVGAGGAEILPGSNPSTQLLSAICKPRQLREACILIALGLDSKWL